MLNIIIYRTLLHQVLSEPMLNNYMVLAQKGKAISFTSFLMSKYYSIHNSILLQFET